MRTTMHETRSRIKMIGEHKSKSRRRQASWTVLAIGLAYCSMQVQVQQAGAILNCFTPKMFNKLGKGAHQVPYPGGGGPERANWYPQQQHYMQQYPPASYGQYPSMKSLLFQPKWKGGPGLLGNKNWASSWKQMGANSNFYRPGFGYGYSAGGGSLFGPMALPQQGNYAANYNQPPGDLIVGYQPGAAAPGYSPVLNTYSSSAGGPNANDGWTVPAQHHINPVTYDSGYTQQQHVVRQPTIDPYASVKGGSNRVSHGISTTSTKKGNILVADGGYSAHDTHLMGADPFAYRNRTSFGYSYPDSYSGVADSPAKIAQQLMKYGLKQQRLQQQQSFARLAPLLLAPNGSLIDARATLEEPKFVGFGLIDALNSREARISCSFNEPIEQASAHWIRFLGPYNSTQLSGANIVPPFSCPSLQCRAQTIEPTKEARYRLDNGPAASTLIISEPRTSDYGAYRCSALSKVPSTNNDISPKTIYKIAQLGPDTV